MEKRQPIKVIVVGYGDFGSRFITWILENRKNQEQLSIVAIVEKNKNKWHPFYSSLMYESVGDIHQEILGGVECVIDCTHGESIKNRALYESLGLPAIFQNGEPEESGDLFYYLSGAGHVLANEKAKYLRVAKCSAMSTITVVKSLPEDIQSNIIDVYGNHYKVNNKDVMFHPNYDSGKEVEQLIGVATRTDVTYMRGIAPTFGPSYHSHFNIHINGNQSVKSIIESFKASSLVTLVDKDIDTSKYENRLDTLVIEESICCRPGLILLSCITFTPELNFPQIVFAVNHLVSYSLN